MIAGGGWGSNIIVYLIEEYNMKSIDAAQVSNVINGSSSFIPVIAAIIADSFFGCYSVVLVSCLISLLGIILITLTSTLDFMRPQHCLITQPNSCNGPSKLQLAFLYTSVTLACIGQGGMRFILATMGADQFRKPHEQATFFNWFFVIFYTTAIFAATVLVYVEDNIGWACGYGISVGANVIGLVLFLIGSKFYRHVPPQGSPFTSIARVIVATVRNYRVENGEYWCGDDGGNKKADSVTTIMPTTSFMFLNRAALIAEDAVNADGSITKPWKCCTVQQVEDLKTLIRISPLWSSGILVGTPIGILASLTILQALTMDRRLGNHFKVPAGSILVFVLISATVPLAIFDKILWPAWHGIIGQPHTPLQRIGVGHVFNVISVAIAALVEIKRRGCHVSSDGDTALVPMSVMWLVPQLLVSGAGEAFHFPGQVELYYREFPNALKNMGTAVIALLVAVAFYLSTALIDLTRRVTDWLPDDINKGRMENVYWVCVVIGVINFGINCMYNKTAMVDAPNSDVSLSGDKRGGWIAFPFILGCLGGLTIAGGGWLSNIIVYLIKEYNMNSIDAAQVSNVANGSLNFIPVIAAIIADSFFGCYSVVFVSSLISLLGVILITLTSTLDFMRPQNCLFTQTNTCNGPSKLQLEILYTSLTLACIGQGGIRFTLATMGADQFRKPQEQASFFNWFYVVFYIASVIASTVIVYVEDNIGWDWGYGISAGANVIGLIFFMIGSKFYRRIAPQGSPFTSIARVIVATVRNYRVESGEYWCRDDGGNKKADSTNVMPTKSFKFLNRAALITEGAINANGLIAKPWKLCTVKQVEDLKTLIRISPLWSSSIFLGTPIGIMLSLSTLQALTMDRHLGDHFKVPAGSIVVFGLISITAALAIFDKILWPTWHRIIGRPHTPLQRIGIGHVITIISLAIAALVEIKRRAHHISSDDNNAVVPMSVMWLVPQVVVLGVAEAFHFPGQVELYYKEFPNALKNMGTAMIALLVAVAFYLSTAVIDSARRVTEWVPDDINKGRVENVYWMVAVIGVINFGYFLICAFLYKYQNIAEEAPDISIEVR